MLSQSCLHKPWLADSARQRILRRISRCQSSSCNDQGRHRPTPIQDDQQNQSQRRALLLGGAALLSAAAATAVARPACAADSPTLPHFFPEPPGSSQAAASSSGSGGAEPGSSSGSGVSSTLEITQRVFLDIGLCPTAVKTGADRRLGDASVLCSDPEPLGRIVIGVYGKVVPTTAANFVECIRSGAYTGTAFNRIQRGEFLLAGQQGSRRMGFVAPPAGLAESNPDLVSADAFRLSHVRPGTVSLALSAASPEDEDAPRPSRARTAFYVTTGPGPATQLDGEAIVLGQVLEGLDVVGAISAVPTFRPLNSNLRAFNELGRVLGDERAVRTAGKWGRPLKAVVITDAGVL